jgi:hypothetical protein
LPMLGRDLSPDSSRNPGYDAAVRNDLTGTDDRPGRNDTPIPHHSIIEKCGVVPDEAVVSYAAAVNNSIMADDHVIPDLHHRARMDDGIVFHHRVAPDFDRIEVAAYHGSWKNARTLADLDITDYVSRLADKGGRGDPGFLAFKASDHTPSPRPLNYRPDDSPCKNRGADIQPCLLLFCCLGREMERETTLKRAPTRDGGQRIPGKSGRRYVLHAKPFLFRLPS